MKKEIFSVSNSSESPHPMQLGSRETGDTTIHAISSKPDISHFGLIESAGF